MSTLDVSGYVPTDSFFGAAYIEEDSEVAVPAPHRLVRGGFKGTDTRFRFHFPLNGYDGRMYNPLSGANGGTDSFFSTPFGEAIGGLSMCFRLGGYMVQSNQGHIGDALDAKAGPDPTIYGHRASAECARLSKYLAVQIYGAPPHHSYVFGGSGGGRRSPLCLENAPGVWDGALPFMGGGDVAEPGNTKRLKGAQAVSFCTMFNVQRILGDKLTGVIDAMAAGGSGDPFAGLTVHQRAELEALYRLGFPRGDEVMIGEPMGQLWQWTAEADSIYEQDPSYFENFWTKPGYFGHDHPELLVNDRIDAKLKITRVLTADEVVNDPAIAGPEYQTFRSVAVAIASGRGAEKPFPCVIEVKGLGGGYRLGTGVKILSGKGAGRQLYCMTFAGDFLFCDGRGEMSNLRFHDVVAGDEVHIDNSRWLAYGYYTRHHVLPDPQFGFLKIDGKPIYPQHKLLDLSPLMGVCYSGQYEGKLMWVHHTHDASLWPPQGVLYADAVAAAQGAEAARRKFRLRWAENAEHVPPFMIPTRFGRASNTWLIDYLPVLEQSLRDLADWVENGIEPCGTNYSYADGKVTLPATAVEREGIQSVVRVTANGGKRTEVRVGEQVTLSVEAEVPPGAGTIITLDWDFDGSGSFPETDPTIDGMATKIARNTMHRYDQPGTYFATARVASHRDGKLDAQACRIPNLDQARIVVSA